MASWLRSLFRWFTRAPVATPSVRAAPRPKSAERAANERLILDTRRQILAKLEAFRAEGGTKQQVIDAIDQDTLRASQVVRQMLKDIESREKS